MKKLVVCLVVIAALSALAAPALAAEAEPWQLKNPVGPQRAFRADLKAVCALDGGTAWAAGAGGAVYFTHDGGASWEAQTTGAPSWTVWQALRFGDRQHGLLAGTAAGRTLVYRTADGGRSWAPAALSPYSSVVVADLDMVGPALAWIVGAQGLVLRSSDGGATWLQSRAGSADLTAVDFTSASAGVAVGSGGAVYRTTDGGRSWLPASVPCRADLLDLSMCTPQSGWAVGRLGTVLSTSDGGRTWQRQWPQLLAGDLVAVDFASLTHGWAVSGAGALLVTTDGGRSWRPETHSMGAVRLRDIDAADAESAGPERAFTAGDGGAIGAYTEVGTSTRGNNVWLVLQTAQGAPLTMPADMRFDLTSINYTSGQAYDGWTPSRQTYLNVSNNQTYAYFCITIQAGRQNSAPPAQWFTSTCGNAEIGIGTTTTTPPTLNFAFVGTLTANGVGYTLALGQGNQDGNNWWIGGPGFTIVTPMSGTYPAVATPDSAWLFTADQGPNDHYAYFFTMSPR